MSPAPEVLKVLLIGGKRVGKTAFAGRLRGNSFKEEYTPTVGWAVHVVPHGSYQGKPVQLHIYDVAASVLSQRDRHSLLGKEASGVILMFDLGSVSSLKALDEWISALTPHLAPSATCLLVGHKADTKRFVVSAQALDNYVKAAGFEQWCCTVGSHEFGDYAVGAGRGKERRREVLARQLSVEEVVNQLVQKVLRDHTGGSGHAPLSHGHSKPADHSRLARWAPSSPPSAAKPPWDCFAGDMGREEAEGILRGRPDGTYMLRRRSPKQLVLSFNTSSEEGDQVQHVLFIYEDGCFTDDKGRLGSFHSLQELLASKISKLVMLPLRFVRLSHSSNYVLAEECEGIYLKGSSIRESSPSSSPTPRVTSPAVPDGVGQPSDRLQELEDQLQQLQGLGARGALVEALREALTKDGRRGSRDHATKRAKPPDVCDFFAALQGADS